MKILEWDYNIEDYLLDDLENGFEIEYMTLDEHCGIWYTIDNWREDISHMKRSSEISILLPNYMKSLHKSFHYIVQII